MRSIFILAASIILTAAMASAKQGAVRVLYTVPNMSFIEQASGDSVVTINDTSGSISSVQTAIDNVRSANPSSVIVIHLLRGAIYSVGSSGLVLGAHECLVAEGAIIQAANSSVTVPLITISSGSTNVSVGGGTLDGKGANIQGISAPSASRVNIDKVVLKNFASDAISLNGQGNSTYDNEMTVTRTDVSGSSVGIRVQNSTQSTLLDNNCHDNGTGILVSAAWANITNNTCHNNTTGIDITGGNDNIVANNACDSNGTGIHAGGTGGMIVSNSMGGNSTAGISSTGTSNNFIDNLFTSGNAVNFISNGASDNIIAYKAPISASGQNYFYPPLIDNQHTDPTIVNGMGRTDLTIGSTTIDDVQNQYNAARSANPTNVIVLHLNGTFTVGANALMLSSNTSVLLNGTIQINSSTTATAAIATSASGQTRISISGGTLDGGNLNGHTGVSAISGSMIQVDGMTLQNFGDNSSHHSGSDSIHFSGGTTPYAVTRCTINKSGARGIWSQLSRQKALYADNSVVLTRACIDADSHTFGSVMMFNFCDSNTYGLFIEQGAAHNTAIGNVSNNSARRDIEVFNNNDTPPVEFNSIISNSVTNTVSGGTGIRNGASGTTVTSLTSDNFFFDNTVTNANIASDPAGSQNYYSQNYLVGGTLSTAGVETFFNSADVSGNLQIHDSNSGLAVVVQNASTTDGAAVVTAQASSLGNGSNNDEWQFVPTTNGFYKVMNANSGLVMAVQGASSASGAPIIQTAYTADTTFNDEWLIQPTDTGLYNFVSRSSGLYLDVPGASTTVGTQLDQASSNGGANQQFSMVEDAPSVAVPDFTLSAAPASQSVVAGNGASYTATIAASNGFTGTVALSVGGLPAGTTATLNPSSVSGSGSSTLSVSTSSSTPAGTYTLTITGTSGSLSHSTTVNLVVTAPPDFRISATPASQNVLPGGSASYSANIGPLNGYTGTVSLTASGLPAGATVNFNPASVTGGSGSSTVTVSTAGTTAAGNYTITITGTDSSANLIHSTSVTLAVSDFSLSATPSSQTVTANSSTSYTANVSALNRFTGTVSLIVSGLPAGATASFNPVSISGSGSSMLTVSTSCSTPAGTYTLTITGTSGGLSHSTSVTLIVNPAASDFTIGASPSASTVTAGGSTSYTVNITAAACFVGKVNLTVSVAPTGASATLNPTSVNGSGSSTLSVSTTTTASTGMFTLTITGTSGSTTHSSTVSLTINPSSGLPSGWGDTDIGSPAIAGSASFTSGTFTVKGGGADIWSTSDRFNYVSQSLAGDVTIIARVASQQNTNLWAKSGVMIRETTAANSSFVHVFVTPGHGVNMQYRNGTGTSAVQLAQIAGPVAPYWVRLVRSGNTFTGFASADGVTWTQVGTISVTMAANALEGLSVCAHNAAALNTSTFDNVSLTTPAPDFSLSASPASQTVIQGASTSYTASVSPLNGFAGTVSLNVSGLPAGANGTFSPSSISGSGSSTLTVTTSSTTPNGTYTLTITGTSGSLSHSSTATLVVATSCVTGSAGDGWHNTALPVAETGTFTAQYDATPSASPLNAVVALSQGVQTAYTGFATLTRFNPSGDIDARNGGAYAAASTIPYSGGVTYHFRLVIDVPSHTYSIFVTPAGGTELTVGTNFAFRSEQSGVTDLDEWGLNVNASNPGSLTTCNFTAQ